MVWGIKVTIQRPQTRRNLIEQNTLHAQSLQQAIIIHEIRVFDLCPATSKRDTNKNFWSILG